MSFPYLCQTAPFSSTYENSPTPSFGAAHAFPLLRACCSKVSALLGVRRKINYVGRNSYGITGLDVASDHRFGLARHWRAGIRLECLFEARRHSAVGCRAVEDGTTGYTARHVFLEGPPCSGRKGQH